MKKIIACMTCLIAIFALCTSVKAAENTNESTTTTEETENKKITVYIFSKDGCPHCEEAKEFLSSLEEDKKYGEYFELKDIQVYDSDWNVDEANYELMSSVGTIFGDDVSGVPYIVIGSDFSLVGYASSEDDNIKKAIKTAYNSDEYEDVVAKTAAGMVTDEEEEDSDDTVAIIAILALVICGCGAMIFFSRKK